MMRFIDVLKRIPLDLGQGAYADSTQGKVIAKSLVPPGQGRKALDIGCRHGVQSAWLKAQGYEVTSVDVESKYEQCQIVDANKALPFADNCFDLVWCSEVIEHLENPKRSLDEMRRVTKHGGRIILTTPNSGAWFFSALSLLGFPPWRIQRADHLHFFTEANMRILCPDGRIYGYFPYAGIKFTLAQGIGLLSPTFVVALDKL